MRHTSVPLDTPCEIINVKPLNPLISKCQIKVCYVSDEPNRNASVITKDVAKKLAQSLPGSPIVGYYNEDCGDFEEHNRQLEIKDGKIVVKDTTRPYGFVDLGAKVWFQDYIDDGKDIRTYLMTEGYIWTGQYPESKRILDHGNNQSMELDETFLDGTWSKDCNGKPQFFIINEAIISKLCILGEDCEPCFEGSQITKFSFNDEFKEQLFSMMNELKEYLQEGGAKEVFTQYAVEIGDGLWDSLYNHVHENYCIEGVYEEDAQTFAILQNNADKKYYRLNFTYTEDAGFVPSETLIEVSQDFTPSENPQFDAEAVAEYAAKKKKEKEDEEEDKTDKEDKDNSEDKTDEQDADEDEEDEEDKKKKSKKSKYSDEEGDALAAQVEELTTQLNACKEELISLREFKCQVEKKEKEAMIESFYMLSDEDKADVIANIDTYSLSDIEAKLSIICVRNKVSFDLDEDNKTQDPISYHLNTTEDDDDNIPAWVRSVMQTAKTM